MVVARIVYENILPIFLVAGLGFLLDRTLRPDRKTLGKVTFYLLSPALAFNTLSTSSLSDGEIGSIVLFCILDIAATGVLGWLIGRLARLSPRRRRAVMLTTMLVNSGNLGLPLILFSFGPEAQARAMIFYVMMAITPATVGVALASGRSSLKGMIGAVLRVPMVYAAAVATLVRAQGWVLPLPLGRAIALCSQATIPVMLLILGMQLSASLSSIREDLPSVLLATVSRLVLAPPIALGVSALVGLSPMAHRACVVEAGTPSAVMSTILSLEYDLEPRFVANVVFLTTLLSPITLSLLIAWLR